MRFTKMQGAGNDFVILNNWDRSIPIECYPELARRICRRRLSVGADGLMVVEHPRGDGNLRMVFFNDDGSEGEMCGNGARCIARYAFEKGLSGGDLVRVETISGTVTGQRVNESLYTVRLADPTVIKPCFQVVIDGQNLDCGYVEQGSPGIPHAVVFSDGWQDLPEDELRELGRRIRHYEGFPKGANVTFCKMIGANHVIAKTFERGVENFTLACGTGCGATATVLALRELVSGQNVRISMPGGELSVSLTKNGEKVTDVFLTGPAETVAEGELLDSAVLSLLEKKK